MKTEIVYQSPFFLRSEKCLGNLNQGLLSISVGDKNRIVGLQAASGIDRLTGVVRKDI